MVEMKLSKDEAGYIPAIPKSMWPEAGEGINCFTCIFYRGRDKPSGECQLVEGKVDAMGCCNLWSINGKIDNKWLSGKEIEKRLK